MKAKIVGAIVLVMLSLGIANRLQAHCTLGMSPYPENAICVGEQAWYQASISPTRQNCQFTWTGAKAVGTNTASATNTWWTCGTNVVTVSGTCEKCQHPAPPTVTNITHVIKVDIQQTQVVGCIDGSTSFDLTSDSCCDVTWSLTPTNAGGAYISGGGGCHITVNYGTNCGSYTISAIHNVYSNLTCSSDSASLYVVKIDSETACTGPNDPARTTIGVGEEVKLTACGLPPGDYWWTTSAGSISDPTNANPTWLTAPSNAATATVTVHFTGGSCDKSPAFTVLEPQYELATTNGASAPDSFSPGQQGVCMRLRITVYPTNVSFYRVVASEISGPATNITDYMTNFTPAQLYHTASGIWAGYNCDNLRQVEDHCHHSGYPNLPWGPGGFDWIIPVAWGVGGSTVTNGYMSRTQSVRMTDTAGTMTVTKMGASATRTP